MEEGGGLDDLDRMEVFEGEQMGIAGDDVIGLAFQSRSQELVIGGIRGEAIGDVQVLGEDRLAKRQLHEAAQPGRRIGKAALEMGRG